MAAHLSRKFIILNKTGNFVIDHYKTWPQLNDYHNL